MITMARVRKKTRSCSECIRARECFDRWDRTNRAFAIHDSGYKGYTISIDTTTPKQPFTGSGENLYYGHQELQPVPRPGPEGIVQDYIDWQTWTRYPHMSEPLGRGKQAQPGYLNSPIPFPDIRTLNLRTYSERDQITEFDSNEPDQDEDNNWIQRSFEKHDIYEKHTYRDDLAYDKVYSTLYSKSISSDQLNTIFNKQKPQDDHGKSKYPVTPRKNKTQAGDHTVGLICTRLGCTFERALNSTVLQHQIRAEYKKLTGMDMSDKTLSARLKRLITIAK